MNDSGGPKRIWFEPYTRADTAVEKVSTEARKDGNNARELPILVKKYLQGMHIQLWGSRII